MENYNDLVLSGQKPFERKCNYILNCQGDKVFIKENKKDAIVKVESMEKFFDALKEKAGLVYYEEGSLHVKSKNRLNEEFIDEIFTLTSNACSSERLQNQIALTIDKSKLLIKNYEIEVISDKYAKSLSEVIYGNASLSTICNKDNIEKLKILYASKKDLVKKILETKLRRNQVTINMIACIINVIAIILTIISPVSLNALHVLIYGLIQIGTSNGYILYSKITTNHILKEKIEKVLEEKEKSFAIENSEPALLEEKNKNEDKYINEIKEKMELISQMQYEGYKEHLMLLYNLLSRYITAKKELAANTNDSGFVLFQRSDIIHQGQVIDDLIEKSIRLHKAKQEKQMLDEIAKQYGINPKEAQEQTIPEEEPYKIELKFGK